MSETLDPPSASEPHQAPPNAPAAAAPVNGAAEGLNWEELWRQLEAGWQDLPRRSEETVQQTLARLQLEWGGLCREARDRLQAALDRARSATSPEPIRRELQALLPLLNPCQWEVVIGSLGRAADRAWVASLLYHGLQEPAETDSWVLSSEQRSALEAMSARAYGNSRLPLVMDKTGQIQVTASAALLVTLIAIEIGSVGSAGALSLLGTPELRRLLNAEGKLRRTGLKQGRTALTQEEWQTLRRWLDPKGSPPDWYLNLTQVGIQTTQVGDYAARRLREFFQSEWIKLVIPPPVSPGHRCSAAADGRSVSQCGHHPGIGLGISRGRAAAGVGAASLAPGAEYSRPRPDPGCHPCRGGGCRESPSTPAGTTVDDGGEHLRSAHPQRELK